MNLTPMTAALVVAGLVLIGAGYILRLTVLDRILLGVSGAASTICGLWGITQSRTIPWWILLLPAAGLIFVVNRALEARKGPRDVERGLLEQQLVNTVSVAPSAQIEPSQAPAWSPTPPVGLAPDATVSRDMLLRGPEPVDHTVVVFTPHPGAEHIRPASGSPTACPVCGTVPRAQSARCPRCGTALSPGFCTG